jgi:SAM-dependent methyltransferase
VSAPGRPKRALRRAQRGGQQTSPEQYDAWYRTPRGAWIGEVEFRLLVDLLRPRPGESLLDVGCGTGWFSRRFSREAGLRVTGIDPDAQWLAFARSLARPGERFVGGRAERLPFADRSFDCTACITALCFIAEQQQALRELLRVTRRRFVLGVLNRRSLLYLREGVGGGRGGYCGAHWHTEAEVRALFTGLPARGLEIRSAIVMPSGGWFAQAVERRWPAHWLLGGFLACAADAANGTDFRPVDR